MKHLLLLPLSLVLLLAACSTTTQSPNLSTQSVDTCVVQNSDASGPGSLRSAINNLSCSTITFASSLSGKTIALTSGGQLVINRDVTIIGPEAGVTISGNNEFRVILIGDGASNASPVTVTLENLTITNGRADVGPGIYIWGNGTLNLNNSTVSSNTSTNTGEPVPPGGGIHNNGGTVSIRGSIIRGNHASGASGGGIFNTGTIDIHGSTIESNEARWGGGIHNRGTMTLTLSTVSNNKAINLGGGGIESSPGATLIIDRSTISNNTTTRSGGGIDNYGTLTLTNSTLEGNRTTGSAAGGGGGIVNYGPATIVNSTFHANSTTGRGGAVEQLGAGFVQIFNSTIVGNTANLGGGINGAGDVTIRNSIVAGNTALSGGTDYRHNTFNLPTASHSLIGSSDGDHGITNGVNGNLVGVNPLLVLDLTGKPLLANNGGPTRTVALLEGSPAINAGDPDICAEAPVNNRDQRGYVRPAGEGCDIGAYEYGAVLPAPDALAPTITITTPAHGAVYLLGQAVNANFACQDEAGGSGIKSCTGTVANDTPIDTATVGKKTFTVTAIDNAGNSASAQVSYTVIYAFSGFSAPLNHGAVNVAKAGQTIPLKWRVTDASGNPITNLTNVTVTAAVVSCDSGNAEEDPVEQYATGNSGLQNLGNGHYQFNWKTPANFSNSCRIMHLNLGDGITHQVQFRFTR